MTRVPIGIYLRRELVCFFLGHRWKYSPRRHTQYFGMEKQQVPYAYRARTGNYMWEEVAGWSAKCTRCRSRFYQHWPEPRVPWYRALWFRVGDAAHHATQPIRFLFGADPLYPNASWMRRLLVALPLVLVGLGIGALLRSDWSAWLDVFLVAQSRLYERLEA